jgi:hypothetical protein
MRETQASLQKLPWSDFSPAVQAKIKSVVSGTPLFHRMPQQTIYADPEIYNFLLQHPDLVIGFWEQLGVTQLSLQEVKENHYVLKETAGTTANVEILHRTNDLCIIYGRGEYRGPLLSKAYLGNVILVLRTKFTRDEANEPMVICDLDSFVQIHSVGADVLAKLFFTSLTKVADSNFEVATLFAGQVSKAASRNNASLKTTAEEITSIRHEVYVDFCDVVDRVALRYARRNQPVPLTAAKQTQPVGLSRMEERDFRLSTKPPADWGMDHFFDTVRYESGGELNVPKPLDTSDRGHAVPKLPTPMK